jgi:hypothetical protein
MTSKKLSPIVPVIIIVVGIAAFAIFVAMIANGMMTAVDTAEFVNPSVGLSYYFWTLAGLVLGTVLTTIGCLAGTLWGVWTFAKKWLAKIAASFMTGMIGE